MAGWDSLKELVKLEIVQRREEGCHLQGFEQKWELAGDDEHKLMEVYRQLSELQVSRDFPYNEPSELEEIRSLRPQGPRKYIAAFDERTWRDKFYGAWLGRLSGCALGKPLESGP